MEAASARDNREEKLNNVYNEIETDLKLIGKNETKIYVLVLFFNIDSNYIIFRSMV